MAVAIVTDSTACIPPELVERYQIEVVPVHIIFGGRTFVDSMSQDTREFYELLRGSGERPLTAAPSPAMFLEAMARGARRADAVVCLTVSAEFSAMHDSARHAASMLKSESPSTDVRVIDSRNAAMAQGFVVVEAARAAAAGASVDDVIARAEAMRGEVSLLALLDTLDYLARSGRVPRVAAWAAGMLQVKPIVRFSSDGIKLVARTRTRARALDQLTQLAVDAMKGRRAHLAVHHAGAQAEGEALLQRLLLQIDVAESYVTEFTQVMGVHTGPGLIAVAWWRE